MTDRLHAAGRALLVLLAAFAAPAAAGERVRPLELGGGRRVLARAEEREAVRQAVARRWGGGRLRRQGGAASAPAKAIERMTTRRGLIGSPFVPGAQPL